MRFFIISAMCLLAVSPVASANLLINGDIENNTTGIFGGIGGWGPSGGWADHAGFARPNNGSLGLYFGFMAAGGTERVGQKATATFLPAVQYTFSSWVFPGGNTIGEIVYQIGYDDGEGGFVVLASQAYNIDNQSEWTPLAGVSYTPTAGGPEIGQNIWVRLGDGVSGLPGNDDVWFDNLTLVPEPGSLLLISLVAAGLIRRR